jgi:UDP-2,3-diacylglucosamine pyrophosphatase LpxH
MQKKIGGSIMLAKKRLTKVFQSSQEIPYDDSSKIILFSDCHRGDNGWADDFADNQCLFFHALNHYYKSGYTYIELGDGDELWENNKFEVIRLAHSHIFWLLKKFHDANRFYLIYGNHNNELKNQNYVAKKLYEFIDERTDETASLFDGIEIHEGLVLKHTKTGRKIFLVHGHQGDVWNDYLWWISRTMVRHFWRHLQLLGINEITSPAQNNKKRKKIENWLTDWVQENDQMLIAGHTHRPRFPGRNEASYYNDGSCVHPRCITGIEIENDEICLIKWSFEPNEEGALYVKRNLLAGPRKL